MVQKQTLINYVHKHTYEDAVEKFGISKWNIYKILKEEKALKIANNILDDYKTPYTAMWACGRPMGHYRGMYPVGMVDRVANLINFDGKRILHLFSGTIMANQNHDTMDVNPAQRPKIVADATKRFPIGDAVYDVVIADPPYDLETGGKNYSEELYNVPAVKPYSFVKEACRILKPGGYLCILHHLVYICPQGMKRRGVVAITTGPNMRIRTLSIFQKV